MLGIEHRGIEVPRSIARGVVGAGLDGDGLGLDDEAFLLGSGKALGEGPEVRGALRLAFGSRLHPELLLDEKAVRIKPRREHDRLVSVRHRDHRAHLAREEMQLPLLLLLSRLAPRLLLLLLLLLVLLVLERVV